jgi:hypothetical protein
MAFQFHAEFVEVHPINDWLSFADRPPRAHVHYFTIQRCEENTEIAVPDMENIYLERDDQCWGGYGGTRRVVLERESLTVFLEPRMATQVGDHESIRVTFSVDTEMYSRIRAVLSTIMRATSLSWTYWSN